ncbi:MAG: hypothetical protein K2K70_13525 [Lachnospiraceae bacterium]|nr:hypothetical protein [Lachnospiraceae bacterium]
MKDEGGFVDLDALAGKKSVSRAVGKSGSSSKGLIDGAPEPEVQNFIERFKKKDIQEENINLDINFNILMAEIILK